MKKAHATFLVVITFTVVAFTAGLYVGRNFSATAVTVSVPEEIRLPPPSSEAAADQRGIITLIDINKASQSELTSLPGIGDGLAGQIIAFREENGHFTHVEQLMNVPGIGEGRLEAILSMITVGGTQ